MKLIPQATKNINIEEFIRTRKGKRRVKEFRLPMSMTPLVGFD